MNAVTTDGAKLVAALEAMQQELTRLSQRVAALEAAVVKPGATAPAAAANARPEALSEELVLVISAAIAAFLGKKPRIRQIRLLGTAAWAQQGRVTIQASHALPVRHI
jgi:methylmalonyl-CoA carboxyltransferase large subunit